MRSIIFPRDERVFAIFGDNLSTNPRSAWRAYRARLERAITSGVLPRKVYVSPRVYGFDAAELEEKLANLPSSYAVPR